MEMLKLLIEAKAHGLSKDEFFHLAELELKINESKRQTASGNTQSGYCLGNDGASLESLLRGTCEKLENQQNLQHQMLVEILDQQRKHLQTEFRYFQQQVKQQLETQLRQHQQKMAQQNELQKCSSQGKTDPAGKSESGLDLIVLDMKERFHEMRNTILNRLEEEKVFMRDALSKAQSDILVVVSRTEQNVCQIKEDVCHIIEDVCHIIEDVCQIKEDVCQIKQDTSQIKEDTCQMKEDACQIKEGMCLLKENTCQTKEDVCHIKGSTCQIQEAVGADIITKIGNEVNLIHRLCEEWRRKKNEQDGPDENTEKQITLDSLTRLLQDLKTTSENKLQGPMDSFKEEVKEVKRAHSVQLPVTLGNSAHKKEYLVYYYNFCINDFESKKRLGKYIENGPLYIPQLHAYAYARINLTNKDMQVWLHFWKNVDNPVQEWKFPVYSSIRINVEVVILGQKCGLPDKVLGGESFSADKVFLDSQNQWTIATIRNQNIAEYISLDCDKCVLLGYKIALQVE